MNEEENTVPVEGEGLPEEATIDEGQGGEDDKLLLEKRRPTEGSNVVLGNKGKPLPEGPVVIGQTVIEMPDEIQQRAGFVVETTDVSTLIAQFPEYEFKVMKPLGE